VSEDPDVPMMTFERFVFIHGLIGNCEVEMHIHAALRCRPQTKSFERRHTKELERLQAARDAARALYRAALQRGEIRAPTARESILATAAGHPDNPSTQAAIRVLAKREARRAEKEKEKNDASTAG